MNIELMELDTSSCILCKAVTNPAFQSGPKIHEIFSKRYDNLLQRERRTCDGKSGSHDFMMTEDFLLNLHFTALRLS